MKMTLYSYFFIILSSFLCFSLYARSMYRLNAIPLPSISIYNDEKKLCATISDSHLELYPHFALTIDALKKYYIPPVITYPDNPSRFLTKKRIDTMIENFIIELKQGQKRFSHFTIIKSKNFNFHYHCGILILKCNYHPFVIKLFIERPETYFNPYCKGVESIAFFFMGGGANRHISGISRLLNLDAIKKKLPFLHKWHNCVKFPRKWLWLPLKNRYMYLVGKNIGSKKRAFNKIPEIFALVTDAIECHDTLEITRKEKKATVINLCNDFDNFLDAHHDNFIFKRDNKGQCIITVIDTEHFPTMVGFKKKKLFKNYWQWYFYLFRHYVKKTLFRTKKERLLSQSIHNEFALL